MDTTEVLKLIEAERGRQIVEKGWTLAGDDNHTDNSLRLAAGLIAVNDRSLRCMHSIHPVDEFDGALLPRHWPYKLAAHVYRKHKGDEIRKLVIAGALLVAEIERLGRKKAGEDALERAENDQDF